MGGAIFEDKDGSYTDIVTNAYFFKAEFCPFSIHNDSTEQGKNKGQRIYAVTLKHTNYAYVVFMTAW